MKSQLLSILYPFAILLSAVAEATATLPQVAIQNLPPCAQACLTSAFVACPCPLLDLICACTCSQFVPSLRNCTQGSCSPSFVPAILSLISGSCETAISLVAASTSTTSSGGPSHASTVTTTPTPRPTSAIQSTLPLTTYGVPGSTGTATIYGEPTPCSSQAGISPPSDCGPAINPSSVAEIMFIGAAGANYTVNVKLDGSNITTNNRLSISTISSSIDIPYLCTLQTVDYIPAFVERYPGVWAIGPPQTILSIACGRPAHSNAVSKFRIDAKSTSPNETSSPSTSESYLKIQSAVTPLIWSLYVLIILYILV